MRDIILIMLNIIKVESILTKSKTFPDLKTGMLVITSSSTQSDKSTAAWSYGPSHFHILTQSLKSISTTV